MVAGEGARSPSRPRVLNRSTPEPTRLPGECNRAAIASLTPLQRTQYVLPCTTATVTGASSFYPSFYPFTFPVYATERGVRDSMDGLVFQSYFCVLLKTYFLNFHNLVVIMRNKSMIMIPSVTGMGAVKQDNSKKKLYCLYLYHDKITTHPLKYH